MSLKEDAQKVVDAWEASKVRSMPEIRRDMSGPIGKLKQTLSDMKKMSH